jgi:hypothetical protein
MLYRHLDTFSMQKGSEQKRYRVSFEFKIYPRKLYKYTLRHCFKLSLCYVSCYSSALDFFIMKLLSLLPYKNVMQFKLFFPVYETWPLAEKFRVNKRMSYLFYFRKYYLYKTKRNRIIHEILYERINDTLSLRRWLEFRTLKLFSQI